jgi:Ribonucleotide reductase, small chain
MSRSSRSTSSRAASSRVSWSSSSFEANQYVVAERGTPARSATARWVTAPVPRSPTSANVARRIVSRRAAPLGTFVLLTGTNVPLMTTATDAISYEDLYARWERGNWRASEIDFSEDARQWREELSDLERRAALRNYALFFWGEDAVADGLSTYIEAAPLDEQKYFLAPQKVDEARHAVFFGRFMHEVVGIGGTSTQERLAALEPQLTWGFRKVFERLETMSAELRRRPTLPT